MSSLNCSSLFLFRDRNQGCLLLFRLVWGEPAEVNSIIPVSGAKGTRICPWDTAVRLGLLGHHISAVLAVKRKISLYGCNLPVSRGVGGEGGGGG